MRMTSLRFYMLQRSKSRVIIPASIKFICMQLTSTNAAVTLVNTARVPTTSTATRVCVAPVTKACTAKVRFLFCCTSIIFCKTVNSTIVSVTYL